MTIVHFLCAYPWGALGEINEFLKFTFSVSFLLEALKFVFELRSFDRKELGLVIQRVIILFIVKLLIDMHLSTALIVPKAVVLS